MSFEQQLSDESARDLAFLKATYEDCEPRDVRDYHRVAHSVGLVRLAREIAHEGGAGVVQLQVVSTAGYKHDKVQLVREFESGHSVALLQTKRLPLDNDDSEYASADKSDAELHKIKADSRFKDNVREGIVATSYRFTRDGALVHPNIFGKNTNAQNPRNNLVNFALAKADILAPLTVRKQLAFNIAMRFFVEQYPDLSVHLHQSDDQLPHATYELLSKDLLLKFAVFERTFMGQQYDFMSQELQQLGLQRNRSQTILNMFNLDAFNATMDASEWSWLHSNAATTDVMRQAVAFDTAA